MSQTRGDIQYDQPPSDTLYVFGFERTRYMTLDQEVALTTDLTTVQHLPIGGRCFSAPRLRSAELIPANYNRMPGCTFKIDKMVVRFR